MGEIFSFTGAGKIVFGQGAIAQLVDYIEDMGKKRPFVVMDRGLAATGMEEMISEVFLKHKHTYILFDKVEGEPPIELADEGAALASEEKADIVVGIGGGSAMDVAKAVAVLAAHGGKAVDYLGLNKVPGPGFPKIMVPTTAGTGSEVTFTSVFIRKDIKKKEGMNSPLPLSGTGASRSIADVDRAPRCDGIDGYRRALPCHRILHVHHCKSYERNDIPGGN